MTDIPSPSVTATPEKASSNNSTPMAQRVHTDSSINFDDTPVAKRDMSPPLMVEPGKGTGHIKNQVTFTGPHLHNGTRNGGLELASPIFSHGSQYTALDRHILEDIMEGVEQTSGSGSEVADDSSGAEDMVRVLVPSVDNISQALENSEKGIQIEWIGTSTFFLEHNIELQGAVSSSQHFRSKLPSKSSGEYHIFALLTESFRDI
jgi:hypothetical protein